jgi:hypothetical protein
MRHCGSKTELPPQGPLGAIGKGNITAAPGDPLGTYGQATWLYFQTSHLAGVVAPGAGCRGMLHQGVVKSAARDHGDEWLWRGACERVAKALCKDDA